MQVVGLEPTAGVGFDRAADALAGVLADRGPTGIVRRGSVSTGTMTDVEATVADGVLAVTSPSSSPGTAAIDRLAAAGMAYAIVDSHLVTDTSTVVVGDAGGDTHVAAIEPSALDDADRLEAVADAIDGLEPYETLESLVRAIQSHPDSPKAGALATFTGRVRAENLDEARTTHLEYEKYEDVADAELEAIRTELTAREGVHEVLLHHNTGVVPAEADAVHVVVLAGHRSEAFRAVEDGINFLKDRVPIFKKEVTETGEYWAHDRP